MAELLVRTVDRPGGFQRGDVIVACPDGWPWSDEERTNPIWRIVVVPDFSEEEAGLLTAPGRVGWESGRVPVRRHNYVDLNFLGGNRSAQAIRAAIRPRPSEPNVRELGGNPREIG